MQTNDEPMTFSIVRDGLRVRNIAINFLGQVIPLIVGVVAIPFVIRGLGVESFGILSFAWMFLGYFTIFDLGLGRATTKFVSEELGKGTTEDLRSIFWTSCLMNLFLGFIGGLIIASLASFLAESVFRIPPGLIKATRTTFFILAASCPIVLVSTAFRGALEAAQRFEYVNVVAAISSSLTFILPLIGLLVGFDIRGIIFLLMLSRLFSALAYLFLCFKVFPILRIGISVDLKRIQQMLKYGGWVSVTNVVHPALTYLDRFFIGSMISIAAVAYYTAPYEMVARLSILPLSLSMTLFPVFSAVDATARESMASLYSHSVKFLLIMIGPLVAVLILFAGDILHLWLGSQFAEISTVVMQILAVGVLMNSLAQIPYSLIQGFGHPDITAKFHVIELLLYIPLVWCLIHYMGIIGGALAWTIRVSLDSLLLFTVSRRFISFQLFLNDGLKRSIGGVVLLICVLLCLFLFQLTIIMKAAIVFVVLIGFIFTSWRFVLDAREKMLIVSTVNRVVNMKRGIRL
jgi:O-antigen/teichoic acid export membrane protein